MRVNEVAEYQNEKDVANTYLLSNGEVTATLYYQPVISAVQFENDLTLFRTTKPPAGNPDYYTPDFVLKFTSSEDDEEYAIFDAKFSSRANIKKHSLPEVIRKYSCEISAASRSSAPKMVWVALFCYTPMTMNSSFSPISSVTQRSIADIVSLASLTNSGRTVSGMFSCIIFHHSPLVTLVSSNISNDTETF